MNDLALSADQFAALCTRIATMTFDVQIAELIRLHEQLLILDNEPQAYWLGLAMERIRTKRDIILQDVVSAMWQHDLAEAMHTAVALRTKVRGMNEAGITVYAGSIPKKPEINE